MTIRENLENAVKRLKENNIEDSNLKARVLLAHILGKQKEYLVINESKMLADTEQEKFASGIEKLINNVPLQYITNKQEFFGINFFVNENVLIPQPDTEILVEEVIRIAKSEGKKSILDLCTGSGAIAIALSNNLENVMVTATDISMAALEIARLNDKLSRVNFKQSEMFNNLQDDKFDIIVSNPPYIKTEEIRVLDKEVQKEPMLALDGGIDGLDYYRIIINNSHKYLNDNGYLCLEIGENQREDVVKLLKKKNYKDIYSKKDLAGNDRVLICNM